MTRKFAVYCMTVTDLQARDITRLTRLIADAVDPIESDVAMLCTCDTRTEDKIRDWSIDRSHGLIVIPMTGQRLDELLALGLSETILPNVIAKSISAYNLYDQREPVTGERFFGRADILRDLERKLAQGAGHVGLFGLRRIGKTSLLLELQARLRKRPDVMSIFLDLESSATTEHAAFRLADELLRIVTRLTEVPKDVLSGGGFALPDAWTDEDALPADRAGGRCAEELAYAGCVISLPSRAHPRRS